jgi:hypothetical protein
MSQVPGRLSQGEYYFYSSDRQAFIIGQLNPIKEHILVDYTLPESYSIYGDGWSYQRDWFAWFAKSPGGVLPNSEPYIVDRSGTRLGLPVTIDNVQLMKWGNNSNRIAIVYGFDFQLRASIIDVDSLDTIADFAVSGYQPLIDWTRRDNAAVITVEGKSPDLYVLYHVNSQHGRVHAVEASGGYLCARPDLSANDRLVYLSAEEPIILINDLTEGAIVQEHSIAVPFVSKQIVAIDTNLAADFLVIYVADDCAVFSAELWLISVANSTSVLLDDRVTIPPHLMHNYISRLDPRFYADSRWSGNRFYAYLAANPSEVLIHDTRLGRHISVPISAEKVDFIFWSSDATLLIMASDAKRDAANYYIYNANDETLVQLYSDINPGPSQMIVRTNMTYPSLLRGQVTHLAIPGRGICSGICVVDTHTGEVKSEIVLSDELLVREMLWSPSGEGLFLLSESIDSSRIIYLYNTDQEELYKLGKCAVTRSCFGWMSNLHSMR